MTAKALLVTLVVGAVGAGTVVFWPKLEPVAQATDTQDTECSTCTARQRDKQRLRRALEKLSDEQD